MSFSLNGFVVDLAAVKADMNFYILKGFQEREIVAAAFAPEQKFKSRKPHFAFSRAH